MLIRYSMLELGRDAGLRGSELAAAYSRYVASCQWGQFTVVPGGRELPDDMDMFRQPEDFD